MNSPPENHIGVHLGELKRRLITVFIAIALCSGLAYTASEPIVRFFMTPLYAAGPELGKLVYTKLTEAFITYLKVALLVGLAASFPVVLYQGWMFVAPGLLAREKKTVSRVIFWATILFLAGACFAYFAVLPRVLTFFMSFAGPMLEPRPKLGGYLTFVGRTILAFGLAFEIPFLMVTAVKLGMVENREFRSKRLYYYPVILVLSLLLSAGDLTAAILLCLPLFGLYESGILVIRMFAGDPPSK